MKRHCALHGGYLKGLHAGLAGEPEDACPYEDRRKPNGRLTWSRAFRTAWRDGWRHAVEHRADALITAAHSGKRR